MMKIEHIAIWTANIEALRHFYEEYFGGISGARYENRNKCFESYFLTFEGGSRLELMQMPTIPDNQNNAVDQYLGLIHMAFSVGSREAVDRLTERIKEAGYSVVGEPRQTGDGYYESCILDPDGNRIEITI